MKGTTPYDLVTALRKENQGDLPLIDFMAGFAHQLTPTGKGSIRHDTPEGFVEDLLEMGYLTPVD